MASPIPMTREQLDERYPGLCDALGTVLDREIANQHGLSRARIAVIRGRLGITAKAAEAPSGASARSLVLWWLRSRWPGTSASFAAAVGVGPSDMSARCRGSKAPSWALLVRAVRANGLTLRIGPTAVDVLGARGSALYTACD